MPDAARTRHAAAAKTGEKKKGLRRGEQTSPPLCLTALPFLTLLKHPPSPLTVVGKCVFDREKKYIYTGTRTVHRLPEGPGEGGKGCGRACKSPLPTRRDPTLHMHLPTSGPRQHRWLLPLLRYILLHLARRTQPQGPFSPCERRVVDKWPPAIGVLWRLL